VYDVTMQKGHAILENHYNWKGGYSKHSSGYRLKRISKGKYVFEHRYIMEEFLGRKLSFNETIHHINGIKTDNRIENLEILSRSEHSHLHPKPRLERPAFVCGICKKTYYTRINMDTRKFCSNKCRNIWLNLNNPRRGKRTFHKCLYCSKPCFEVEGKDGKRWWYRKTCKDHFVVYQSHR